MKHVVLCLLTGLLFSCNNKPDHMPFNKQMIIEDVTQTLNSYHNSIKTKGLTAEFAYLDSSADFFWVPPGYSNPLSYDSVAKILTQSAPVFASIENIFDTLRIIPLSSELVTYTGKLHSRMTDTTGHITNIKLIETGTLIKRKDGWKLLNGQTAITQD